jgi:hypothetical protein
MVDVIEKTVETSQLWGNKEPHEATALFNMYVADSFHH